MHSLHTSRVLCMRLMKKCLIRCRSSHSFDVPKTNLIKENNVLVERYQSVTMIGINRPEKKNSLDTATALQLSEALDDFENDETAVVGVLHGVGGNFCAGYDLEEVAQYDGKNEETLPQFGSLSLRSSKSMPFAKPIVAAISGYAVGFGFELALMCDIRITEDTAEMGFLNRRFGIPILSGGTVRLPTLIGYSRAIEVIMTGRLINSTEAFNWGLATYIGSYGTSLGKAISIARSLVKFPQRSLLADRASAQFATFSASQIEEALQFEKDNGSPLLLEEGVNGAKRFFTEKLGRHGKFYNITAQDETIRELDEKFL